MAKLAVKIGLAVRKNQTYHGDTETRRISFHRGGAEARRSIRNFVLVFRLRAISAIPRDLGEFFPLLPHFPGVSKMLLLRASVVNGPALLQYSFTQIRKFAFANCHLLIAHY